MPRDKKESHDRIVPAALKEFLSKGFDKASIRNIAAEAGLTSAALYRHFENKEEMFNALVQPGISAMREWMRKHEEDSYAALEEGDIDRARSQSEVDMIREVVFPHRDSFKLLLCCAQGTRYENFIHDVVEEHQKGMWRGIMFLKAKGYPVKEISQETLHMLMSAYLTALFEPIVHDYPMEDAERYLDTILDFFMPGWQKVMGL